MAMPCTCRHNAARSPAGLLTDRFVTASAAVSNKLAYVDLSTDHAIIKVDNTTTVPYNDKRNTVRINTLDKFSVGSVWVADMV
jgi:hypothetical protein